MSEIGDAPDHGYEFKKSINATAKWEKAIKAAQTVAEVLTIFKNKGVLDDMDMLKHGKDFMLNAFQDALESASKGNK